MNSLPTINDDDTLSFNGVKDTRYKFPLWSRMSRKCRVFFTENGKEETIQDMLGEIEVLRKVMEHKAKNP